jgi:hypothetical protein
MAISPHQFAFIKSANSLEVFSLQQSCRCYLLHNWGSGILILGNIKIRRNFYIVLGDLGGFLDFWQERDTESPQNQLVRKVRKVRRSSYQIWTATDRRETKKTGRDIAERWRPASNESAALLRNRTKCGKEAVDQECRSRSPSMLLHIERATMPLIRETLPLTWVTAAAHKRHDLPFMNLVALFMLS